MPNNSLLRPDDGLSSGIIAGAQHKKHVSASSSTMPLIFLLGILILSGCSILRVNPLRSNTSRPSGSSGATFTNKKIGFSISLPPGWNLGEESGRLFSAKFLRNEIVSAEVAGLVDEQIPFLKHHLRIASLVEFPRRAFVFTQGKITHIEHLATKKITFGGKDIDEIIWAGKREGIPKIFHTILMPLERAVVLLYFEFPASLYHKPNDAIQSILRNIEILPAKPLSPKEIAQTYQRIGRIYMNRKLWDEAATAFTQALFHKPKNSDLYVLLGESHLQNNVVEPAFEAFMKATQLSSQNAAAHKGLGETYFKKNAYEKGIRSIKRALTLSDDEAPLFLLLGNAYLQMGNTEGAIRNFQKLLIKGKLKPEAHLGIGKAYLATDLYEQAIFEFNKVLELQPQDREPHCLLEKAYMELNALDEAEKEGRLCKNSDPETS